MERAEKSHRRWTADEIALATKLHNEGVCATEIGKRLGRTRRSIKSILYQPRRGKPNISGYLTAFYDGPAIETCPTQQRLIEDAIAGSHMLKVAILKAIVRQAA